MTLTAQKHYICDALHVFTVVIAVNWGRYLSLDDITLSGDLCEYSHILDVTQENYQV